MLSLDPVHTLAFAGLVLFLGQGVRRLVPPLARYNIPSPVVGGMLVAALLWAARSANTSPLQFDTATQAPLMIAFFTTLGFGASLSALRVGGPQVVIFLGACSVLAVVQNVIGAALSVPLGMDPLFGVLNGSVTLTGGPGTGLAFAPEFEKAGVPGAASVAVAAAMVGIVSGGLVGAPLGTFIIERYQLRGLPRASMPVPTPETTASVVSTEEGAARLLRNLVVLLVAMWLGSYVSRGLTSLGITLPAYIGAMIVAAVIRNLDDKTALLRLHVPTLDDLGSAALSLFLALSLMTLKLWELASVALPMLVILVAQVAFMALLAAPLMFRMMGRDYDAAVMAGGLVGFMLGTTANAMANMESLTQRYGLAPRAFLVVPMVGACFVDFTNSLIITAFLQLLR
ncbi:MAG: sodium/glutamate symporter [Myxococcota bacterium]